MGFFDGAAGGIIGGLGSLVGGAISATNSKKVARMNIEAQREFAQNGVRWRVADAKAAGVHPSVALGMSGASFTPVSGYTGDYGISEAAQQFGQGISRAAQAKMTKEEREQAQARQEMQDVFQLAMMNRQVKYQDAQIDLMNSEIARNKVASYVALMRANPTPAMPSLAVRNDGTVAGTVISGQGDSTPSLGLGSVSSHGLIKVNPAERTANALGSPGTTAASIPDRTFVNNGKGGYAPVRSEEVADRLDDDIIGTIAWHLRNSLPAVFDIQSVAPPADWLPSGATHWLFDLTDGSWYPNTVGTYFRKPAF